MSRKILAESELTNCWDSRLVEMMMTLLLREEEEEAEEVAEEVPKMLAVKEVAEDRMLRQASRRLRRTSQHYEYDLGYNNQGLGRSSSLVVDANEQLKDRYSFKTIQY